jgi:hypothetical protein
MTTSVGDWDNELEPGEEELADYKARYGPLFKTSVDGILFYFRTLTRAEAVLLGLVDGTIDPETEEQIFLTAMVHPASVDFDTISAGAPSRVSMEILERSGFAGAKWINEYLHRAREKQTAYHAISATICAAFPSVMPGELDELNIEQLMELCVQAEEILAIKAAIAAGTYVNMEFESDAPREDLSNRERHEMVVAMLNGGMEDVPRGWIDRTKVPPGANIVDTPDDML